MAPVSGEENSNEACVTATVPLGPDEMEVSGPMLSMLQVRVAGVASRLPTASTARTENVCAPSSSPV